MLVRILTVVVVVRVSKLVSKRISTPCLKKTTMM